MELVLVHLILHIFANRMMNESHGVPNAPLQTLLFMSYDNEQLTVWKAQKPRDFPKQLNTFHDFTFSNTFLSLEGCKITSIVLLDFGPRAFLKIAGWENTYLPVKAYVLNLKSLMYHFFK